MPMVLEGFIHHLEEFIHLFVIWRAFSISWKGFSIIWKGFSIIWRGSSIIGKSSAVTCRASSLILMGSCILWMGKRGAKSDRVGPGAAEACAEQRKRLLLEKEAESDDFPSSLLGFRCGGKARGLPKASPALPAAHEHRGSFLLIKICF